MTVQARNREVEKYLPLVGVIAYRLWLRIPHQLVDQSDLESAGVFGLMQAVEGFDAGAGVKFETYATRRISGAMLDYLRQIDWVPRHVRTREDVPAMRSLESMGGRGRYHDDFDSVDMKDEAESVLGTWPRECRSIFTLYHRDGLTMKEVGRAVGLGESRVSQILIQINAGLRASRTRQAELDTAHLTEAER